MTSSGIPATRKWGFPGYLGVPPRLSGAGNVHTTPGTTPATSEAAARTYPAGNGFTLAVFGCYGTGVVAILVV